MLFDDAFIHLRIARNLALRGRAFFNPGERIMATSSPLWTAVLAGLGIATHRWLLAFLEAGLLTGCGVLAYLLSRRLLPATTFALGASALGASAGEVQRSRAQSMLLAGLAGLLTMLLVLPSSIGQMETPLAMALLLGAMYSFAADGWACLPLLALAGCARLEMLPLFAAACLVAAAMKFRRSSIAAALGIVAAMAIAVYAQFGVLLPNSMRAKAIGYAYDRAAIVRQLFDARFLTRPLGVCLAIFLGSMLADQFLALRMGKAYRAAWVPALSGVWGVCAMLEYVIRDTPIFEWYRPIIWLPLLLCLLLYRSSPVSSAWLRGTLEAARFVALALLMVAPFWKGSMIVKAAVQDTPAAQSAADRGDSARVQEYLAAGGALRETCPRGTLMTAEIGALGWAFDGYIWDAFGIASPGALGFQPLRSGAPVAGIPAGFAAEILPDIVVSYSTLDVEVRQAPFIMAHYDLIELPPTLPGYGDGAQPGWHGSSYLDVMLRKDGVCPAAAVERALDAAIR
ncbi:MAG: hypothetical protein ACYCSN_02760 [Acidobacteriaceae bacterium]